MLNLDTLSSSYIVFSCYIVIYICNFLGLKKIIFQIDNEDPIFYIYLTYISLIYQSYVVLSYSEFQDVSDSIFYKDFNISAFWLISSIFWIIIIFMDYLRYNNEQLKSFLKNRLEYYIKPGFIGLFFLFLIIINIIGAFLISVNMKK